MQGMRGHTVKLLPHDEAWAEEFERTKAELCWLMDGNVAQCHHVGSTAIRGIVAKPVLDVSLILKSMQDLRIQQMEAAGYEYRGERRATPGRHLFVRRRDDAVDTHYIHCYHVDNKVYMNTVLFCRFLNEHPEYAREYNDLKLALVAKDDFRYHYSEGKAAFIVRMTEMAKELYGWP